MTPSVSRIVHWVGENGEHLPAIVTRVHSDTCVNLSVFPDVGPSGVIRHTSVMFDETNARYTWHWPERDGQTH